MKDKTAAEKLQGYGITVENHPRSNIIVGTTNAESGFLRDITGNRRFWPVDVSGTSMYKPWDLKEGDQIWAEELFLKGEVAAMAYDAQKQAMECDAREGIISEYLEKLLPTDWNKMDLYERRSFLRESDLSSKKGTVKREKVCIMEIWCECFIRSVKTDSYEIESIINRIGGWERLSSNRTGKTRYPLYGPQITFIRNNK